MNSYIVKVQKAYYITHDVKCFIIDKPPGYDFFPGQATIISINLPGWEDERRPFTITSLREQDHLEFIIKIYRDHEGVTNKLGEIDKGSELIIHDVFGAIQYKGQGVFIAGGAGITPFISVFRSLYVTDQLQGNRLIYSNKTQADVILEEELQQMLKNDFLKLFTRENADGSAGRRIDRNFLIENIKNFHQYFYVCGPDEFVNSTTRHLLSLGASTNTVVFD
jgi:ferredoxin-NADP reductase